MKTKCSTPAIALAILITLAGASYAKIDTVLQVVPTGSVGWVRVSNLADLNEKVDRAMQKITPPGEETPEGIILAALSEILPIREVSSVPALEELGLDARGDLSVFWIDASFQKPLIAVHIKDRKVEASLQSFGREG